MLLKFREHKVKYVRIQKNACSTVIASLGHSVIQGRNPHDCEGEFLHYDGCTEDWPCIAVLRDPFDRVVSAFLDKFTSLRTEELFAHELADYIWRAQRGRPRPTSSSSITLREFITHIASFPDDQLDPHWRSQSSFLSNVTPTHFIQMDLLSEVWPSYPFLSHIPLRQHAPHATRFGIEAGVNLVDVPGEAFASFKHICGAFPIHRRFREKDLVEHIKVRFASDYALIARVFSNGGGVSTFGNNETRG